MDKTIRNVIIFAVVILVMTSLAVVMIFSNHNAGFISQNIDSYDLNSRANITSSPLANGEVQNVKLTVVKGSYVLTPLVLKKDIPVRMEADLNSLKGCSRDIVISAFNVRKYVQAEDNIISFTPTKTGVITIACSMNMYRGTFTVVDS